MIFHRKAQTAVWGLLTTLLFVAIAGALVDVYRLFAARNWAYSVAQEAALTGASRGRDWDSIMAGGDIRLLPASAKAAAENLVAAEMDTRGVHGYGMDVRVLPDTSGGSVTGYPPRPVRLGNALGNWTSDEPAVGVYLVVPVNWLFLDRIGIVEKTVSAFAAAGVSR
jgi:hypothetical protein